jgi:hypothetical protein
MGEGCLTLFVVHFHAKSSWQHDLQVSGFNTALVKSTNSKGKASMHRTLVLFGVQKASSLAQNMSSPPCPKNERDQQCIERGDGTELLGTVTDVWGQAFKLQVLFCP